MRKLISYTLILLLVITMQGCRKKHVGPENGFVWYEVKENGLYGAVDQNDNELLPCQFQSIELSNDWKNGNDYTDYLWQLKWNVVDENGDKLEIRLYTFDDGWRYYYTRNLRTEKTKASNRDYSNVVISYADNQSISTLYASKKGFVTKNAPSITKQHYFYVSISQYGCGIYTENGEPIIPIERQVGPIAACEQDGRAWYMYGTTVCDAHGTEIFRWSTDDCISPYDYNLNNSRRFKDLCEEFMTQYKWFGELVLSGIVYDSERGFGSLQAKYDVDDNLVDYYIRYTGIKLSSNSSSFDVKPSGNNSNGKYINLRTYTQGNGSVYPSNNYDDGGHYTSISNNYETPSYEGDYGGGIERTPTKHWHNVTREEDCHFCHGTGDCWTCNGKGWVYNEFGLEGTHDCPNCNHGRCSHCNGTGRVTKIERVYE
ncbi:MAG: hypothetical protein II551_01185 [Paludibacteraceae bacterium]|nr:hypothetical protein [Paludibacteraceae bacterium]